MSYTYQWQRCDPSGGSCINLPGETASTYVLVAGDVGHTMRVSVSDGSATVRSAASAVVGTPSTSGRWFVDGSYINTLVGGSPTIDPGNAGYQTVIRTSSGMWGNGITSGGAWGTAVYHATALTPSLTVSLDVPYLGSSTVTFPHDPSWLPSPDSDAHLAVISPDGSYYEFQALNLATSHAHSVATGNVLTGDAVPTSGNAVSPLPLLAGMIRPEEVAAGIIPHALRLGVPWASTVVRSPAIWSDGHTAGGPPSGARLWLPAVPAGLSAAQTMVCTALHAYGGYIGDASGSFAIYFESTADGSAYPFSSFSLPSTVVSALEVLAP